MREQVAAPRSRLVRSHADGERYGVERRPHRRELDYLSADELRPCRIRRWARCARRRGITNICADVLRSVGRSETLRNVKIRSCGRLPASARTCIRSDIIRTDDPVEAIKQNGD